MAAVAAPLLRPTFLSRDDDSTPGVFGCVHAVLHFFSGFAFFSFMTLSIVGFAGLVVIGSNAPTAIARTHQKRALVDLRILSSALDDYATAQSTVSGSQWPEGVMGP